MAGKPTYADLVKKNVASVSSEQIDETIHQADSDSSNSVKNSKSAQQSGASHPTLNNGVNGHSSPFKTASPVPVKEVLILPEVELEDNIGFKLVKGRERKQSTSSRKSGYRNSSSKLSFSNRAQNTDEARSKAGKMISFDDRRDEEKVRFLKKFPKKESLCFAVKAGDVFSAEDGVSLAHCVSEDFEAKDGISKIFKERYGNTTDLLAQNIKTGGCASIQADGRHIFYLVTRQFGFHRPYYSSLEKSLIELRSMCVSLGVTELAMPLIGNRQDQLDWDLVSLILDHVFSETQVNLTVFKYKSERNRPPVQRSRKRTEN